MNRRLDRGPRRLLAGDVPHSPRPGWVLRDMDALRIRRSGIFAGDTLFPFVRNPVLADNDVSWRHLARYYVGRLANRPHLFQGL